jgi:hypothetical protein
VTSAASTWVWARRRAAANHPTAAHRAWDGPRPVAQRRSVRQLRRGHSDHCPHRRRRRSSRATEDEIVTNFNATYGLDQNRPSQSQSAALAHSHLRHPVRPTQRIFAPAIGDQRAAVAGRSRRLPPAAGRLPPLPQDLRKPDFSADDFPYVTFGNIGVLAGWLRQNFPKHPSPW